MSIRKYEDFKLKNYNTSFLMNRFVFQSENFKNKFISGEKSNYDFYYFLGKDLDITKICQVGLCCGYYIGLFLMANNKINDIFLFDTNNNRQILRFTKNNLLLFNIKNKNYIFGLEKKDFFDKLSSYNYELLIIFDYLFCEINIEKILYLFEKNKFISILVLDNLKDEINFENKVKIFCIIKNIAFEKFLKRNNAIVLRKR